MTLRWTVRFEKGPPAFVKAANTARAAQWLRREYEVYRSVRGDFLPGLIGWLDDPRQPILVLEDLSDAVWPPPWSSEFIGRVLQTLSRVRNAHSAVSRTLEQSGRMYAQSWKLVRANPMPFLSLGLCTRDWLRKAISVLQDAEASVRLDGSDLLHGDVKGGNVCFAGARTVLVDWNWACRGNALLDAATWLPSLEEEGGPAPEQVLPDSGPLAAAVAGNLALRAPKPPPAQMPELRSIQTRKLRRALAWVCRVLHLPAADALNGPGAGAGALARAADCANFLSAVKNRFASR
jgi:hypothetical protein